MRVDEFNALDAAAAADVVGVWAEIPSWVAALVAERPYATVDELASRAGELAGDWSVGDLDAALAQHPRIGERPHGAGAAAEASRGEQAAMATAADDTAARIAHGNAAYEQRFGRVFLIRAAGRSSVDILRELDRRLESDADAETREAIGQLTEIALLRLRSTITEDARLSL